MKRKLLLIATATASSAVAAIVLPAAANAQPAAAPPRYDYVGASLAVPEIDEIGIELEGSTAVADRLVVFGRFFSFEPRNGFDYESLQLGVGRIWHIRRNVDLVGSIAYAGNEIDTPARQEVEEEGIVAGAQLRGWATPRLELSGAAMLDNSRGSSTDTVLELGVQYLTEPRLSYGGQIRIDEDDTTIFVGLRFYFGASRLPIGP
jgi:hypothetical protein